MPCQRQSYRLVRHRQLGFHRNTGGRNGKRLDVLCCIVFELKGGRIISDREHFFDPYVWDEFWS